MQAAQDGPPACAQPASWRPGVNYVHLGDNLPLLRRFRSESVQLIYIDPPFNTGRAQARTQIRTFRDPAGDRTGFQGHRYRTVELARRAFDDAFDDYLGFLAPRLDEARRLLTHSGAVYVHLDYREAHYVKLLLDDIFGRDCFLNEVIWAYDYGGRTSRRWPPKHDNILVYVRDPKDYFFSTEEVERIPYMAPGLVGAEKAARGKLPTDTWWHTIVPTNGKERTGYPTQKPLGVVKRIVQASSRPGDTVLDFFAGSGTSGEAAYHLGRRFVLIDNHPEALAVMARRFASFDDTKFEDFDPAPYQPKVRQPQRVPQRPRKRAATRPTSSSSSPLPKSSATAP